MSSLQLVSFASDNSPLILDVLQLFVFDRFAGLKFGYLLQLVLRVLKVFQFDVTGDETEELREAMEILEPVDELELPPLSSSIVAIAVNRSLKSEYAVRWALERFVPEGRTVFKLLHVRARILTVPTPMGNHVPISEVRDDVAAAYRTEVDWQTTRMLDQFKKICTDKKVEVEALVLEADDVPVAISKEIRNLTINELVIGASSSSIFKRKIKGQVVSARISECAPKFCTVYVVSKGKLSSVRSSTSESCDSIQDGGSDTSSSTDTSPTYISSQTDQGSVGSYSHCSYPSLPIQRFQALQVLNKKLNKRSAANHARSFSLDLETKKDVGSSYSMKSDIDQSRDFSFRSFVTDHPSWYSDQASGPNTPRDSSSSQGQVDINFELEKMRIELRHVRGMYAVAQNETINASRQLSSLSKRRMEEAAKLRNLSLSEERTREEAKEEKEKHEAVRREVMIVMESARKEASQRKEAELRAARDAKEKEKLEKALEDPGQQYKKFKWEDIVSATSSFSDDLRIGMGAFGTVYKCSLNHVTAAVKVLHSKEGHKNKQFQQELEILSKIRHPHLLLLLGACLDQGCLVYEYMENGSLEDRLQKKNNSPPIPWFERFRIAWEVASALIFLHNTKPMPIIHRDLKPANILLDHNLVSKIGDVGLSTSLPTMNSRMPSMWMESGPVGTLCYIDPEYQRSGIFSPKSDVYAFGMVILQLLTAKPALALAHNVETAWDNGNLKEILDSEAGSWPIEETQELALLGMSCVELRQKDRPDLKNGVIPVLERLKKIADKARDLAPCLQFAPPSHFICPLLKDVMENPCVASDGYTYERKAIEMWFEGNENSPITDTPFPDKNLTPNYTLLSAIMVWKSRIQ